MSTINSSQSNNQTPPATTLQQLDKLVTGRTTRNAGDLLATLTALALAGYLISQKNGKEDKAISGLTLGSAVIQTFNAASANYKKSKDNDEKYKELYGKNKPTHQHDKMRLTMAGIVVSAAGLGFSSSGDKNLASLGALAFAVAAALMTSDSYLYLEPHAKELEKEEKQKLEADKKSFEDEKRDYEAEKQKLEADKKSFEDEKRDYEAEKQKLLDDKQAIEAEVEKLNREKQALEFKLEKANNKLERATAQSNSVKITTNQTSKTTPTGVADIGNLSPTNANANIRTSGTIVTSSEDIEGQLDRLNLNRNNSVSNNGIV